MENRMMSTCNSECNAYSKASFLVHMGSQCYKDHPEFHQCSGLHVFIYSWLNSCSDLLVCLMDHRLWLVILFRSIFDDMCIKCLNIQTAIKISNTLEKKVGKIYLWQRQGCNIFFQLILVAQPLYGQHTCPLMCPYLPTLCLLHQQLTDGDWSLLTALLELCGGVSSLVTDKNGRENTDTFLITSCTYRSSYCQTEREQKNWTWEGYKQK